MVRFLISVCLLALLAGCTPFTLVSPGRQSIGTEMSVEPSIKWNKIAAPDVRGNVEVWTLDGAALNTLIFFTGVPDGEPLFTRRLMGAAASQQEKPPVFRASMNAIEIQELFQATAARFFQTTLVEATNVKPASLGATGFRFDTRLVGRDEVERTGVFVGTIRNKRLYGMWFQGAKLHYSARYLPEFERLTQSVKFSGRS